MTVVPYLSVVVGSRNDDHGGDLLHRMLHCFRSLRDQAHRHALPVELICVEWNPPPERPPLAQAAPWPAATETFRCRFLTVPKPLHDAQPLADRVPFFQYLAKNVGIRRATGPFVLATNIDVLLSDALAAFLAERRLAAGLWYRADRWDVDSRIPLDLSAADRERRCLAGLRRVNHRFGVRRFTREDIGPVDEATLPRLAAMVAQAVAAGPEDAGATYALDMHTNACGDFMVLHRTDWARLRGYPEYPIHSWHFDTMFLAQAQAAGLREAFTGFERPVYHLDHAVGWVSEAFDVMHFSLEEGGDGTQWLAPKPTRIPILCGESLTAHYLTPIERAGPLTFNPAGWGLADRALAVTEITADGTVAAAADAAVVPEPLR